MNKYDNSEVATPAKGAVEDVDGKSLDKARPGIQPKPVKVEEAIGGARIAPNT